MALGTALASVLGIANLNQHVVKDTRILMSVFKASNRRQDFELTELIFAETKTNLCESYIILTSMLSTLEVFSLNNEQWFVYNIVILAKIRNIINNYNLVAETGYGKIETKKSTSASTPAVLSNAPPFPTSHED